jgi:hypothetical protein
MHAVLRSAVSCIHMCLSQQLSGVLVRVSHAALCMVPTGSPTAAQHLVHNTFMSHRCLHNTARSRRWHSCQRLLQLPYQKGAPAHSGPLYVHTLALVPGVSTAGCEPHRCRTLCIRYLLGHQGGTTCHGRAQPGWLASARGVENRGIAIQWHRAVVSKQFLPMCSMVPRVRAHTCRITAQQGCPHSIA